ncbi:uncharacterized protein [Eleutherodactylus coqui]|uniref:uncharacterized protein n=1 Tax=Eleutherodactylus coqui TaxID=57060 RepID=UPI003461F0E5
MDVGAVTTNLPGRPDSPASMQEHSQQRLGRGRGGTPLRHQPRRTARRPLVSSESEEAVRGWMEHDAPDAPEAVVRPQNETARNLSPCSRVDHAVLGYLRGRKGADWAELYCASLVPIFNALPPHLVPKMKVGMETLFESATGENATEECFWLLAQWSLHDRGRYPNRGTYSSDHVFPHGNPSEHGPEPVSDLSPFLQQLRSPDPPPTTHSFSTPSQSMPAHVTSALPSATVAPESIRTTIQPSPVQSITGTGMHTREQTLSASADITTPIAMLSSSLQARPPRVKQQRQAAARSSAVRTARLDWATTSSEDNSNNLSA